MAVSMEATNQLQLLTGTSGDPENGVLIAKGIVGSPDVLA